MSWFKAGFSLWRLVHSWFTLMAGSNPSVAPPKALECFLSPLSFLAEPELKCLFLQSLFSRLKVLTSSSAPHLAHRNWQMPRAVGDGKATLSVIPSSSRFWPLKSQHPWELSDTFKRVCKKILSVFLASREVGWIPSYLKVGADMISASPPYWKWTSLFELTLI